MLNRLMATERDWSQTALRLALGLMIFPHGAQKALGWFGGYGLEGTLGFFGSIGVPTLAALLVIAAEFLGGLALIAGLLSRVAAVGVAAVMTGAVFLGGHLANGFFMNWSGTQAGEGWEFHLLAVAIAVAVAVRGGGALSVDRALTSREPIGLPEQSRPELRRAA